MNRNFSIAICKLAQELDVPVPARTAPVMPPEKPIVEHEPRPMSDITPEQWSYMEDASRMVGPRKIPIAVEWAEKYPDRQEALTNALRSAFERSQYVVTMRPVTANGKTMIRSTTNFMGPTGLPTELVNYKRSGPIVKRMRGAE